MSAGWTEIFVVALTAQLAVLPGEKVQFIIAGLSTRFKPWIVVAAAGSAFAIWTAIEILIGAALQGALPGEVLNVITAGLFLLFAVLLFRSAREDGSEALTDGSGFGSEQDALAIRGYEVPQPLGGFLPIFGMMAAGEFGDKTQLVTIGLAIQYGAHPAIWFGEMAAIIPVSIANAYFFHRISDGFNTRKAHLLGAALFAFFGLDTLLAVLTGFSLWETAVNTIASVVLSIV
ncbi:MAG: TMEM165/GDT1 family protein [Halodesulfurarchaeum sp.]